MLTSARNLFGGRVKQIKGGPVNTEVLLDLGGGSELAAIITADSLDRLGLVVGGEALALTKASWVLLTTDEEARTSARNRLCGVVAACKVGPVNAEVEITLPGGGSVTAVVTHESVDALGLEVGVRACALIKASHVILAVHA